MLPFWYRYLYLLNGLLNEYYYKTKKKTVAAAVEGKAKALPAPVQPELDSSDEEILETLALGAQGK